MRSPDSSTSEREPAASRSPADRGYGFVTHFHAPGGFAVQLYQPKYAKG